MSNTDRPFYLKMAIAPGVLYPWLHFPGVKDVTLKFFRRLPVLCQNRKQTYIICSAHLGLLPMAATSKMFSRHSL